MQSITPTSSTIRLRLLVPPYLELGPELDPEFLTEADLPRGSLLCFETDNLSDCWPEAATLVARCLARFPMASGFVRCRESGGPELAQAALRLGRMGVRAILLADESMEPTLRDILTAPIDLPGDLAEWVQRLRADIDPVVPYTIRQIAAGGASQTLASLGEERAQ